MKPRIVLVLDNVHMAWGHKRLKLTAKKHGVDLDVLDHTALVVFLNRRRDKLKILGGTGKVVGYVQSERGERIALDAIQYIPQTFGGQGFSYDQALKEALMRRLAIRRVDGVNMVTAYHNTQALPLTTKVKSLTLRRKETPVHVS